MYSKKLKNIYLHSSVARYFHLQNAEVSDTRKYKQFYFKIRKICVHVLDHPTGAPNKKWHMIETLRRKIPAAITDTEDKKNLAKRAGKI